MARARGRPRTPRRRAEVHPAGPPCLVAQLFEELDVVVVREPRHLSARELPVELPLLDGRRHEGLRSIRCCSIRCCSIRASCCSILVIVIHGRGGLVAWVIGPHLADVHTDHRLQARLPNLPGHQGMAHLRQHGHIAHHFVEN